MISTHPLWQSFVEWHVKQYGMPPKPEYRNTIKKWEAFLAGAQTNRAPIEAKMSCVDILPSETECAVFVEDCNEVYDGVSGSALYDWLKGRVK